MSFRECNHIKADGLKCQSPALNRQSYCYFHHRYNQRQRRRIQLGGPVGTNQNTGIEMPIVESWETIQIGLQEILEAIVDNRINSKRAGLMLYALQLASQNLKMMKYPGISQPTGVLDTSESDAQELNAPTQQPVAAVTPPQEIPTEATPPRETTAEINPPQDSATEANQPHKSATETNPPQESANQMNPPQPSSNETNPHQEMYPSREGSPARECGEPGADEDPSRATARRQIADTNSGASEVERAISEQLVELRQRYPRAADKDLIKLIPQPNDDDFRLYLKPDDSKHDRQRIINRRLLAGIPF